MAKIHADRVASLNFDKIHAVSVSLSVNLSPKKTVEKSQFVKGNRTLGAHPAGWQYYLTQRRQRKRDTWSSAGGIAVLFDAEEAKETGHLELGRRVEHYCWY